MIPHGTVEHETFPWQSVPISLQFDTPAPGKFPEPDVGQQKCARGPCQSGSGVNLAASGPAERESLCPVAPRA